MFDFMFGLSRTERADNYTSPAKAVISKPRSKISTLHLNSRSSTFSKLPSPASSNSPSRSQHRRRSSTISTVSEQSPSRTGPSSVAWLNANDAGNRAIEFPSQTSPQIESAGRHRSHIHPIGRSASSPPTSSPYHSSITNPPKGNLRLHMSLNYSRSTHSLRLDSRHSYADDGGIGYGYPLVKQLSPIAEQDYFSPEALRRSIALPPSDHDASASLSYSRTSFTPNGSQQSVITHSDITRPSPVYSHPTFITRPLNRTISQSSSRTHVSTGSSTRHVSTTSSAPPSIPPLDLRPPFPGPHPASTVNGQPPLRSVQKASAVQQMPTISGSAEDYVGSGEGEEYDGDAHSLHAESFVTATDGITPIDRIRHEDLDADLVGGTNRYNLSQFERDSRAELGSLPSIGSRSFPSSSSSFIDRRWDRNATLGTGLVTFPRKVAPRFSLTPACWIFWAGWLFPPLWLIGGWYFTLWGESGLTWWSCWTRTQKQSQGWLCGRRPRKQKGKTKELVLPRWVVEKADLDGTSSRLNEEEEALRGIWFGYPFITPPNGRAGIYPKDVHAGPFWFLGKVPILKITEVGPPDWKRVPSARRVLDPWIWRCRVASVWYLIECCIVFAVLMAVYKPWLLTR